MISLQFTNLVLTYWQRYRLFSHKNSCYRRFFVKMKLHAAHTAAMRKILLDCKQNYVCKIQTCHSFKWTKTLRQFSMTNCRQTLSRKKLRNFIKFITFSSAFSLFPASLFDQSETWIFSAVQPIPERAHSFQYASLGNSLNNYFIKILFAWHRYRPIRIFRSKCDINNEYFSHFINTHAASTKHFRIPFCFIFSLPSLIWKYFNKFIKHLLWDLHRNHKKTNSHRHWVKWLSLFFACCCDVCLPRWTKPHLFAVLGRTRRK